MSTHALYYLYDSDSGTKQGKGYTLRTLESTTATTLVALPQTLARACRDIALSSTGLEALYIIRYRLLVYKHTIPPLNKIIEM